MLNIQQFEAQVTCNDLYPVQVLHQKFSSTAQDFVCCFSKNCHFNGTIFGNNSVETYGFFFFFGCHCLFYVKGTVWPSLKSFFIFYAIFIVTRLYLIWSKICSCCLIFFTVYKIRIKIVLLLLFTFHFVIIQVLEMTNSGTLMSSTFIY